MDKRKLTTEEKFVAAGKICFSLGLFILVAPFCIAVLGVCGVLLVAIMKSFF